jgi:hypothetical protein
MMAKYASSLDKKKIFQNTDAMQTVLVKNITYAI